MINLLSLLPPGTVVDIVKNTELVPLDISIYDVDDPDRDTLAAIYNLTSGTRYDVLYEIRTKGLFEPGPYMFLSNSARSNYPAQLFEQTLVDFIAENDFGPVDPRDPNSPPLKSYFCMIGGENSACPGKPNNISSMNIVIMLVNFYIDINNLRQNRWVILDDNLRELLEPKILQYNQENPTLAITNMNAIEGVKLSSLLKMFIIRYYDSPNQIENIKNKRYSYLPYDEKSALKATTFLIDDDKSNENRKQIDLYNLKWGKVPLAERQEARPIDISHEPYDINSISDEIEKEVGHELSQNFYQHMSHVNEGRLITSVFQIRKIMNKYPHLF